MSHLSVSWGASNGKPRSLPSVDGQQAIVSYIGNAMKLVKIGEKLGKLLRMAVIRQICQNVFTTKVFLLYNRYTQDI